jgi:hypothetical protein
VGRDVLVGALLGIVLTLLLQIRVVLPPLFGRPGPIPLLVWPGSFTNVPFHLLVELPVAIEEALQWFFLLFLLVLFVRKNWLAVLIVFLFGLTYYVVQEPEQPALGVALMGLMVAAGMVVVLRFGLLAHTVGLFFCFLIYQTPLSIDFSTWYALQSMVYLAVPTGVVTLAFLIALGGQPLFRETFFRPGK